MSSGRRDVSLVRRALRYERDTGEVSSNVGMCACVRACVSWSTHPNLRKYPFFSLPLSFFRQILSHWDRLPLSVAVATPTNHPVDGRSTKGPRPIDTRLGRHTLLRFRDVCSFCQVPLLKRDDSVCYPFAQGS